MEQSHSWEAGIAALKWLQISVKKDQERQTGNGEVWSSVCVWTTAKDQTLGAIAALTGAGNYLYDRWHNGLSSAGHTRGIFSSLNYITEYVRISLVDRSANLVQSVWWQWSAADARVHMKEEHHLFSSSIPFNY